jgi:hypothetical protein
MLIVESGLTRCRIHRPSGDQTPLDQLVRIAPHDLPILARPGLALIRIHDQVPRPLVLFPSGLVHKGPLEARRETGTAAATQAGILDLLDDPRVALEEDFLGLVPVASGLGRRTVSASHRHAHAGTHLSTLQPVIMATEQIRKDPILVLQAAVPPHGRVSDGRERTSGGRGGGCGGGVCARCCRDVSAMSFSDRRGNSHASAL